MADYASIENTGIQEEEETAGFDIRSIITIIYLNWYWIALSVLICYACAKTYLHYTQEVYQAGMKVLIKDSRANFRNNSNINTNALEEMGVISNSNGFDNEMEILKSRVLALDAVKDLKLYVEYRKEGRLRKILVYKYQPISVDLDAEHLNALDEANVSFSFKLYKDGDVYRVESPDFTGSFKTMPAALSTPYGTLTFSKNMAYEQALAKVKIGVPKEGDDADEDEQDGLNGKYIVTILPPTAVAAGYAGGISIEPTSKLTSIAQLTIRDCSALRAYEYLKQLAIVYNRQANADKNEIAVKTEEFINSRLEKINSELGATESELESYKRSNNLVQMRIDATQTMTQANQYYGQLMQANTQIQILDELRRHIDNPSNRYQIIPSNVGLSDAASSSLIAQYNKTVLDRNRLLASASETSPLVMAQTTTLDQLEVSIQEALRQARRTADIQQQSIQKQYNEFQSRIANTPEQERILTQIGRQQEVKSGLYLMLLQKREENSISLAATADKGKLIDEPSFNGKVSPKSAMILMACLVLGFAIPLVVFYLLQLLRYKIEGHGDVVKLTNLPIIADVAVASETAKDAAGIVVRENQNNQIDEIFRSMRTNVQFMMTEGQKVVLFTSAMSGEGKTFNAANLAVSFALLGKKVILLGLDIRKPALGRLFDITDRQAGITTLLTKEHVTEADLKSQIRPSGVNKNLDLLLAGPVPPNPTEMLARPNLGEVFGMLKKEYDYIILDTAPVGLVTDTIQVGKFADVTVFVCRADYTPKASIGLINSLHDDKKMNNICIVINGIDMSKKKYGYYYGYGKYGKYGRYGYGRYGGSYGNYGNYGNYANSHYGNKDDNSLKR